MQANTFIKLLLCIYLQLTLQVLHSQELYYPDSIWQTKRPAELKMNAPLLDSAVNFAMQNDSKTNYNLRIAAYEAFGSEPNYSIAGPVKDRGKPAGIIIRHGYIAAQWGDVKRVDMTFSVTKSYLSGIAGLAVDNRLIKSVDDPVNEYVTDDTYAGAHNSKITWRHLLTQSSDWAGCLFGICDWADRPVPTEGGVNEWKNRTLYEPGTHFKYNDVRVNLRLIPYCRCGENHYLLC